MTLPRAPPIGNLVGYSGDDDDDDDEEDSGLFGGASHLQKRRLSVSSEEGGGPPATPRLSHRRIGSQSPTFQPLPSPDDEDEEDTLLESLVTGPSIKLSSTPSTPSTVKSTSSPTGSSPELGLMRMGEKRRRGGEDDDDDDEWMLERLATKAKRISNAVGNCGENAEGGPKKIRLILNKLGSSLSIPSQPPTSGSDGG